MRLINRIRGGFVMRYLYLLIVVPIILALSYGGCGSSGSGDGDVLKCITKEIVVESECLAEDLLNICEQYFCGASFPPNDDGIGLSADFYFPPRDQECFALDCSTLDCESFGSYSNLEIGNNGRPTGFLDNNPDIDSNPPLILLIRRIQQLCFIL